jgi:hypothetical protein
MRAEVHLVLPFRKVEIRLRSAAILAAIVFPSFGGIAHAAAVQEVIHFKGGIRNTLPANCGTSTYDSICPSTTCRCEEYEGLVVTGNLIGKVTNPESNFPAVSIDITVDAGADFVGSVDGRCAPIFATAFIVGTRDTQQIDFNGSYCTPLANVSSPKAKSPILGGFGIESSTAAYTGYGTVTGSVGFNSGSITLTFKGPAVKGP